MRPILICIILFASAPIYATTPRTSHLKIKYSENGAYYLKTTPYSFYPTELGKTVVYDASSNTPIDSIGQYLFWEFFISNDGKSVFHVLPYAEKNNLDAWPVIEVHRKGVKNKFFIRDLIKDSTALNLNGTRRSWIKQSWLHNDSFFVLMRNETAAIVDPELNLFIVPEGPVRTRFNKNIPVVKENWPFMPTPQFSPGRSSDFYYLPLLVGGGSFHDQLLTLMGNAEVKTWQQAKSSINIEVLIDRMGRGIIYELDVTDKKTKKHNKLLEDKIKAWVTTLKFTTADIPEGCEKWLFYDFAYLRD